MATKAMRYENAIEWLRTNYNDFFFRYPNKQNYDYQFDMQYEFYTFYGAAKAKIARLAAQEARRWAAQQLPKTNERHLFDTEWRLLPYNEETPTLIKIVRDWPKE